MNKWFLNLVVPWISCVVLNFKALIIQGDILVMSNVSITKSMKLQIDI